MVIAGGGTGERRWGLWELCEDKEQRGSPVVCLITPECIFLFLVIPVSVCAAADDLILSLCLLLNYCGEEEDRDCRDESYSIP